MRHWKSVSSRMVTFFYTEKVMDLRFARKELKRKVRHIVNTLGPQLFKNFDKLQHIMKMGSASGSRAGSRGGSKSTTPHKSRSRRGSNSDDKDLMIAYED